MSTPSISYKRYRFPADIFAYAVWLYCRFDMSFRELEELLLVRGIDVSYETIRGWITKFGPAIARGFLAAKRVVLNLQENDVRCQNASELYSIGSRGLC
jgi:putative transposase